ncbi:hypothetical protein BGZ83_012090 [Gryganskiella cystojenkinii]|nr:hypothetical protein BGZ83_012090 [Gryganskiella cystojenkinii]
MANPLFDDFLELDLLDPSDASNDMYSYYLSGSTDDNNVGDLGAAAAALAATEDDDVSMDQSLDLVIKQEVEDDSTHALLRSPAAVMQDSNSATAIKTGSAVAPMSSFAGANEASPSSSPMLVSPDQLTIAPQATTVSPSTISLKPASASSSVTATLVSTLAASSSGSKAPATVSVNSSKTASATTKRSSPEPAANARKHAKTESVSKTKAASASSRKTASSSTGLSSTASAKSTNGTKSTSTTSSSSSPSSSALSTPPSSSAASVEPPTPTSESLTSPVNTTLSAATLQLLLQQQMETPLIPQLFTGKLTREEIEETLVRLLESTKHLIAKDEEEELVKVKEEHVSDEESDNDMDGIEIGENEQGHGLKTQPGIKTDDIPSSTDLKKMTSKERRQLRNKISARNFRVRRKEYIFTLEGQVLQHKTEARHLREAVTIIQEENIRLRDELEIVRRQLADATLNSNTASVTTISPDQTSVTPLSKENQNLLSSIMSRNSKANVTLSVARPQSPILTPNLHKDIPNSSNGSSSQSSWKDKKPIMVHTTLVPEICLTDDFQFGSKAVKLKGDDMTDRPWLKMTEMAQDSLNSNPFWASGMVFELMTTFTCSAYEKMLTDFAADEKAHVTETVQREETVDELAWELQQNLWAMSSSQRETENEEDGELTAEQIELLCELSQVPLSSTRSAFPSPSQEDPNMLDWLYESMMARLVELDLQGSQERSYAPTSSVQLI